MKSCLKTKIYCFQAAFLLQFCMVKMMSAWIYVISDSQRENQVCISYVEQDPTQWQTPQNESMQLEYAVKGQNPHRAKLLIHQHLHLCKCLPDDKHDDWFECGLADAIMLAQWASGTPRLAEMYAHNGLIFQQEQNLIQLKKRKKARLILGIKYAATVLCVGVACWAFRWWWTH